MPNTNPDAHLANAVDTLQKLLNDPGAHYCHEMILDALLDLEAAGVIERLDEDQDRAA